MLSSTSLSELELDSYASTLEGREVRALQRLRDLDARLLTSLLSLRLSARLERLNLVRVARRLLYIESSSLELLSSSGGIKAGMSSSLFSPSLSSIESVLLLKYGVAMLSSSPSSSLLLSTS